MGKLPNPPRMQAPAPGEMEDLAAQLRAIAARAHLDVARMAEESRQRDLLDGITVEDRARIKAQEDAELPDLIAKLRAENDALEAELVRGRKVRQTRRTKLRLVES